MTSPGLPHPRFDRPPRVPGHRHIPTPAKGASAPEESATGDEIPCLTGDPETWFAESPEVLEHAKSLCGPCPLREMCLQGALERGEPWGVWGGELFDRGRVIPRKRTAGRPRKDVAA